jgi:glycosyltransferase involved in cell wall biosynthesis
MKIVIANPYFPPFSPGGAEHSLEQMCQRFVKQGWIVHVITNCYDGNPRVEDRDGYTVKFDYCPIRLSPGQQITDSEYIYSKKYFHRLINSLIDSSHNGSSEIIFIANNAQCFIPVAKAGKITGVPTIGIVRDTQAICETGVCIDCKRAEDAIPCKGLIGSAKCMLQFHRVRGYQGMRAVPGILLNGVAAGTRRERLRRNGLKVLDQIVTISDALHCLVRKLPDMKSRKIITIRNFYTDNNRSHDDEVMKFLKKRGLKNQSYFLVAGKKSYGKGSDIAIEAMKIVHQKHPKMRILFVGRETVNSSNHVSYVDSPPVSQAMLLGLLSHSRALLIPGRRQEGLHRTMIDALYLGIPIICTDAGAPKEGVIEGINGYVTGCADPTKLAKAMEELLSWDKDKLEKCSQVSLNIFNERFSDEVILSRWESLIADFYS